MERRDAWLRLGVENYTSTSSLFHGDTSAASSLRHRSRLEGRKISSYRRRSNLKRQGKRLKDGQ
jgi:hypothetical protein